MGVSVGKLLDSVKDENITLLAGGQGLNRMVRWVHPTETEEICGFLQGEEVVLITGVALEKQDDLINLVKASIKGGASAIIVNIGPYIKEIAASILEICEERQVPLFSVPWNIYMAEIMRKFCFIITLEDKKEVEMSSAIKNAIFFPEQGQLYMPYLENYGLKVDVAYITLLLSVKSDKKEENDINKKMMLRQIENYSYNMKWDCTTVQLDNDVIILFSGDYTEEEVESSFKELINNCTSLRINKEVYYGIGECVKNIRCIGKSYYQAKKVVALQKKHPEFELNARYSSLGVYKILLNVSDKDVMNSFVKDTIGKILKYDEINDSNLEEVLRVYLKNNGSVKETADTLFIHRNTVNYKINKINKILEINLSDYESCSMVLMALKLNDILDM